MANNSLDFENLIVLVEKEGRGISWQIAKIKSKRSEHGWDVYTVRYPYGLIEDVLGDDFKIFHRYCNGSEETKECVDKERDFVSLREEFKRLNKLENNDRFSRDYGLLFR